MLETLVLDRSGLPIEIVDWQKAVTLIFENRAISVANYIDKPLRSPSIEILTPSVIQRIGGYSKHIRFVKQLPFNRKNVYLRDKGRCCYCDKKVGISSFTFDHIHPQCLGGKSEWLNVVIACMRCNSKKGCKLLSVSGLKLLRKPYIPSFDKAVPANLVNKIGINIPHETWVDYFYWNLTILE